MLFLEIRDSRACGLELWADIEGYEGKYQVSTEGRVRSLNYNHTGVPQILKAVKDTKGYLHVGLNKDGKQKKFKVHRLVAQAFLYCKDRGSLQINHKDENKTNNRIENLEYCDCKYNINYGTKIEKQSKPVNQLTLEGKLIKTWPSTAEAERKGFHSGHIVDCCKGRYSHHKGFKWCYA